MSKFNELKQQIVCLQKRIEELEGSEPVEVEAEPESFEGSVRRDKRGSVVCKATESYEDRQRQRVERRDAEIAEEELKSSEGLPFGLIRDPFGIIRHKGSGEKVNLQTYMAGHDLSTLYQRGKLLPGQDLSDLAAADDD